MNTKVFCYSITLYLGLQLLFFPKAQAQIQLDSTLLDTTTIVQNLPSPAWEILWGPDNWIWYTEVTVGRVSKVNPETGEVKILLNLPDVHTDEHPTLTPGTRWPELGLFGMVLHPEFEQEPFVYLFYNYLAILGDTSSIRSKLVKYAFDPLQDTLIDPEIILDVVGSENAHHSGRMVVSPDHKIMLTSGDARKLQLPQDTSSIVGKILRINLDGSVPEDNPIPGSYVWSWGHRNAMGLVYSPDGQILYSSENGPGTDDEINIIEVGKNYGWPYVHGFCDGNTQPGTDGYVGPELPFCEENEIREPLLTWTPTVAPSGMDFYNFDLIPEFEGKILLMTLKERDMRVLTLSEDGKQIVQEETYFNGLFGRLRDICISPSGDIYVSTSNTGVNGVLANTGKGNDDKIIRISVPNNPIVLGLEEEKLEQGIHFFPNPSAGVLNIKLTDPTVGDFQIRVRDAQGRELSQYQYKKTGVDQKSLDLRDLAAGMYWLEIRSAKGNIVKRVIKN